MYLNEIGGKDKGNCKDTQRKVICSIGRSGDVQKYTKVFGYSDRENQVFASAGDSNIFRCQT